MVFASTIRKCNHDLDLLFKRSWALFWHKYSTNDDPCYDSGSIDWCSYLKAARDGTPYDHKPHALPRPVLDAIKPVFDNLCSWKSLASVIDASSQNPNEGFLSFVWLMSPKHKATSGTTFQIACHLAIIIFNDEYFALGKTKGETADFKTSKDFTRLQAQRFQILQRLQKILKDFKELQKIFETSEDFKRLSRLHGISRPKSLLFPP
ncbi:unnamed protein product [Rotaria sp. Silwood2]|nr:unnamed protein product [Rotaria sp. Silwood2]CAF3175750.1 unnamed protein product [Rotaria sp. Silwood2]CAF3380858.1 unnamed protein product [Rotaria sp. Silwood2]CAF4391957.1 unnamed protein product [Rotaria sp. Silwood2]CAF4543479.1 unnamed protein product [Rotaria sp. Silwood2]